MELPGGRFKLKTYQINIGDEGGSMDMEKDLKIRLCLGK